MTVVFSLTLFLSAGLLFLVQPMIAKMILPRLGGTPAVWNTCMVFFQAALLAGYAYADALPRWLGVRRHLLVHLTLLLVPLLVLPLAVADDWRPDGAAHPVPWLLALLTVVVGLPFFVVATSAPLLQKWFASTGHASARDPYFLYAASNVGSLLVLLAYPTLVEPLLPLRDQTLVWTAGYVVLVGLTTFCAALVWRSSEAGQAPTPHLMDAPTDAEADSEAPSAPVTRGRWLHWLALAFVPSSMMLGVTTYLTTDIASMPLLWVLPLTLYLLSFVLVFAKRPPLPHAWMVRSLPLVLLCLVLVMVAGGAFQLRALAAMPLHLAALFWVAMVCHGELAARRPAAAQLTTFYLCMSLGGVLGGVFNALLAPVIFTTVLEYPLVIAIAGLLIPRAPESTSAVEQPRDRWLDWLLPTGLAALTAVLVMGFSSAAGSEQDRHPVLGAIPPGILALLVFGVPTLIVFGFAARPVRFGLGLAAVLLVSLLCRDPGGQVLHRERSFFGDLHVRRDPASATMQLLHGTTLHGKQSLDPSRRAEPLAYFHKSGPVGELFRALRADKHDLSKVAVTGLGIGTLLCYAEPGETWTYFEIDPAVTRVAQDTRYFTYMSAARERGVVWDVVAGDARLQLERADAGAYKFMVSDVFSSDAIPVHLLTKEAIELYRSKLEKSGLLLFNISNRYLRLEPVLAALAQELNLVGLVKHDHDASNVPGKTPSSWLILAERAEDLPRLPSTWRPLENSTGAAPWTDDYSNLLGTIIWRH